MHKDTDIQVDILPENGRPGTPERLAPTTIPHPRRLGAAGATLRYVPLTALVELKLAAGRLRDEYDVLELIRSNEDQIAQIRSHLAQVHQDYLLAFDRLIQRATAQEDG